MTYFLQAEVPKISILATVFDGFGWFFFSVGFVLLELSIFLVFVVFLSVQGAAILNLAVAADQTGHKDQK